MQHARPALGGTSFPTRPIPAPLETYGHDTELRRVSKSAAGQDELYLYEGPSRVGVIERAPGGGAGYSTKDTCLFAGIDDALRLKRGSTVVYFETDLAGNVRRLRAPGGGDLGGYRYSAFGREHRDGRPASPVEGPLVLRRRRRHLRRPRTAVVAEPRGVPDGRRARRGRLSLHAVGLA